MITFANLRPVKLLFCLLLMSVLFVPDVHAQANQTITIIPPRFELFANPGDTLNEQIRIRNEADAPVMYSVKVEDFTTSGEEGHVVLEEGETANSFSLARWIEPETRDIILQPEQEISLSFRISVPRDAEPGGHYASVLFQSDVDDPVPGTASVSQRIGSLILLRVSGNVTEDGVLESFSAPSYQEKGPVTMALRVQNNGNVHIQPQGTIIIKNMFGKKVDEIPLDARNVLPGAIRKMDTTWDAERLLGRYTATLVATYGQQNKPMTAAVSFTVASKMALIIIGGATIAIVGLVISLISGRKRFGKALRMITTGN